MKQGGSSHVEEPCIDNRRIERHCGRSLADELAARGYDLIVNSASEQLEIAAAGGVEVAAVRADLAKPAGVKQLWDEISALDRKVDVACINAVVGVGDLFAETDLEAELNMVNLNCVGTLPTIEVHRARYDGTRYRQDLVHGIDRWGNGGAT